MHIYDRLYIGGRWADPTGSGALDVVSPYTTEVVGRVPYPGPADVDRAVSAARSAFDEGDWPRMSLDERMTVVERFTELYATRLYAMSELISTEMGCPITFSRLMQAPMGWLTLSAFIKIAQEYRWEEARGGTICNTIARSEPVGVVTAIVPWNIPQAATLAKLAPALLAGCTVIVKPAPESPLNAMLMAELLAEAGVPEGVVSVLPGGGDVGERLVRHPGVDKVAFTGSTAAGRQIAAACGERLKRVSLELGGKSAAIVLDDADIGTTMAGLKNASLMINGQACIAQTRILASRRRYDEIVGAVASLVGGLCIGDPLDEATEIGPLVSHRQQQTVEKYIALGQDEGARLVVGGNGMPDGESRGWFVRPTVFADVSNDMRVAREEIFGPVLCVIPYDNEAEAIDIANDSEFGLAGGVWTEDVDHGLDVARRIRTGVIGVNMFASDLAAPFGGYKDSGIGREYGREGLAEYLELKSMSIPLRTTGVDSATSG